MAKRPDYRSEEAKAYRHLYWSTRWRRLRAAQLSAQPLCANCLTKGTVTPATVAHHVVDHKGDEALFWGGELQSLCKPCHDGDAQFEGHRGFGKGVDDDGWPTDARHAANRPR